MDTQGERIQIRSGANYKLELKCVFLVFASLLIYCLFRFFAATSRVIERSHLSFSFDTFLHSAGESYRVSAAVG